MSLFPNAHSIIKEFMAGEGAYLYDKIVSNQVQYYRVPRDKIWVVLYASMNAVDAAVRQLDKKRTLGDKLLGYILYGSSGTGHISGPGAATGAISYPPHVITENLYLRFWFSAAQVSGGDFVYLMVQEYDKGELFKNYREALRKLKT